MLRGVALDVRVARTKGYTFGDTLRNIYSAGDSPQKTTARIIRIDLFGKFGRFLKVVKLFSVKTLDSLVKEDHTFLARNANDMSATDSFFRLRGNKR